MSDKIIVVGSYSVGLFFNGRCIPNVGETRTAEKFFETFGGKGSNQAVTAAKLGGNTKFICKLGKDHYADAAIEMYKEVGLYGDSILQDDVEPTSVGCITVDENGNNAIIINLGANLKLTSKEVIDIIKAEPEKPFIVGFQLENDPEMVIESIKACSEMGIPTLLDPAPVAPLPEWTYPHITYIKPNEHEASLLSGIAIHNKEDAFRAGRWFLDAGVCEAIITLGEMGTVYVTREQELYFPTFKVDVVDTTGAGDNFSGALMKAMCDGKSMPEAIIYANCTASLSVTKPGVTEAVPSIEEVEALYAEKMKEVNKE